MNLLVDFLFNFSHSQKVFPIILNLFPTPLNQDVSPSDFDVGPDLQLLNLFGLSLYLRLHVVDFPFKFETVLHEQIGGGVHNLEFRSLSLNLLFQFIDLLIELFDPLVSAFGILSGHT